MSAVQSVQQAPKQFVSAVSPFVADMKYRMSRAGESYGCWKFVVDMLTEKKFSPAVLVYDIARDCPLNEIKSDLLEVMRNFFLELLPKELPQNEGRVATYVTTSSLVSSGEFLKAKVLMTLVYGVAEMQIPKDVLGRFNACQRVLADEGGYTATDLMGAGYVKQLVNKREAYVHPQTKDTIVLPDAKKLGGGALLSLEEQAKRAAANKVIREKAKLERKAKAKPVKLNVPKSDADKKGKKSGKQVAKKK